MFTTRCTICGKEFTDQETMNVGSCPSCGTKSLPCSISEDVMIKINWHELRILTIWAENYARMTDEKEKDSITGEPFNLLYTVMVIAERLQRQFPEKTPLTLFGELRALKKELPTIMPGAKVISDWDDDLRLGL